MEEKDTKTHHSTITQRRDVQVQIHVMGGKSLMKETFLKQDVTTYLLDSLQFPFHSSNKTSKENSLK